MPQDTAFPPAESLSLSERVRRGELFAADCPSRAVLRHVTGRWSVLVLLALMSGTHRFSELRRKVAGVSERMLAQTLQWLEADGFVRRVSHRWCRRMWTTASPRSAASSPPRWRRSPTGSR